MMHWCPLLAYIVILWGLQTLSDSIILKRAIMKNEKHLILPDDKSEGILEGIVTQSDSTDSKHGIGSCEKCFQIDTHSGTLL